MRAYTACILANIAFLEPGQEQVLRANGVRPLVQMLKSKEDKKVTLHSTAAVQNLTYKNTACCEDVVREGGEKALKKLLQVSEPRCLHSPFACSPAHRSWSDVCLALSASCGGTEPFRARAFLTSCVLLSRVALTGTTACLTNQKMHPHLLPHASPPRHTQHKSEDVQQFAAGALANLQLYRKKQRDDTDAMPGRGSSMSRKVAKILRGRGKGGSSSDGGLGGGSLGFERQLQLDEAATRIQAIARAHMGRKRYEQERRTRVERAAKSERKYNAFSINDVRAELNVVSGGMAAAGGPGPPRLQSILNRGMPPPSLGPGAGFADVGRSVMAPPRRLAPIGGALPKLQPIGGGGMQPAHIRQPEMPPSSLMGRMPPAGGLGAGGLGMPPGVRPL